MARDVQRFQVTIPAGTPANAPLVTQLSMPARIVERVQIAVPPGPRGNLGIALGAAGVQYLPSNPGGFLTPDNQFIDWPLEDVIESGAWQLIGYNTGQFDHSVEVVFLLQLPPASGPEFASPTTIVSGPITLIGVTVG